MEINYLQGDARQTVVGVKMSVKGEQPHSRNQISWQLMPGIAI
jgi:hypothetical protein